MSSPTPTIMFPASRGPSALRPVGLCSQGNETSNDREVKAASILRFRQTLIPNGPPLPQIHSIITNIISRVFPHLIVLNMHLFTGRSQFIITLKVVLRVAQEVTKCKFDDGATSTQRRFEGLFSSFPLLLTPLRKGRRDILETRLHELHLGFFVCLYRSILRRV